MRHDKEAWYHAVRSSRRKVHHHHTSWWRRGEERDEEEEEEGGGRDPLIGLVGDVQRNTGQSRTRWRGMRVCVRALVRVPKTGAAVSKSRYNQSGEWSTVLSIGQEDGGRGWDSQGQSARTR